MGDKEGYKVGSSVSRESPATLISEKRFGLLALLVFLTLANIIALVFSVSLWQEAAGQAAASELLPVLSTFFALIALAGLAGAWFLQPWGAGTHLTAQALAFLTTLVIVGPSAFAGIFSVLLAVLLWRMLAK